MKKIVPQIQLKQNYDKLTQYVVWWLPQFNNVLSKRYSKHAISENIKYLVACFSFCQAYADGVNKDETLYKELFVDPRPDQARSRLECLELN